LPEVLICFPLHQQHGSRVQKRMWPRKLPLHLLVFGLRLVEGVDILFQEVLGLRSDISEKYEAKTFVLALDIIFISGARGAFPAMVRPANVGGLCGHILHILAHYDLECHHR
jgi:hypothetical protein